MTHKLLIVDDETANLRLLERLFAQDFYCLTASSGADAIQLLEQHDVAVLISDQRMPQMTGIELLTQTAILRPHMVRILLTGYTDVETLVKALNSGLVYKYVTKPWNNDHLKITVNRAVQHYESNRNNSSLALTNGRLLERIKGITQGITTSLAEMLKARDEHSYSHALRVRKCAMAMAEIMGLGKDQQDELSCAALLHDLGHPNISQPVESGEANVEVMVAEAHAKCEALLLANIPELGNVADIVRTHRENFDGNGSPLGLGAEQIPMAARIIRVAHEYDLLRQPTVSVTPMDHDEAMLFIGLRSGKQLDPTAVEILSQRSPESYFEPQPLFVVR